MAGSGEYNIGEAFIDGSTPTGSNLDAPTFRSDFGGDGIPAEEASISIEFSDGPGDYPGASDIKSVPRPAPTVGRK